MRNIADIPKEYKRLAHITKPKREHALLIIMNDPNLMFIESVLYVPKTGKIIMWNKYESCQLTEILEALKKQRYEVIQRTKFYQPIQP
jgi:hypothetical protein